MCSTGKLQSKFDSSPFIVYLHIFLLLAVGFLLLPGCSPEESTQESPQPSAFVATAPTYKETGDLPALKSRGYLRVLSPPDASVEHLPRQGFPHDVEEELLESLAASLGLKLARVTVNGLDELIPSLIEGKGDLIAANFTMTPERQTQIGFTVPVAIVREQVVTRQTDKTLAKPADLKGRTIVVPRARLRSGIPRWACRNNIQAFKCRKRPRI